MTTNARIRRVSSPAYYLARPAALWLAAFTPQPPSAPQPATQPAPQPASPSASESRPEPRPADRLSCVGEARGPAADLV